MTDDSLIRKLQLKSGQQALLLNAPPGYRERLGDSTDVVEVAETDGGFDFVQVFVEHKADVDRFAPTVLNALKPDGLLWFCYPKGPRSGADINRDHGWESLRNAGYRPVTQVAIDATWSALRFREESRVKGR